MNNIIIINKEKYKYIILNNNNPNTIDPYNNILVLEYDNDKYRYIIDIFRYTNTKYNIFNKKIKTRSTKCYITIKYKRYEIFLEDNDNSIINYNSKYVMINNYIRFFKE